MIRYQSRVTVMQDNYCPHCGGRLVDFAQLTFGNIELRSVDETLFEGVRIHLTKNQYVIVDALVRAQGRLVTRSLLAMAMGRDVYDNTVTANIKRTRDRFCAVSPDFDQLQVVRGFGAYRWEYRGRSARLQTPRDNVSDPDCQVAVQIMR